jgi:formylglycine-generating enzyme required for sulfatase activity
MSMSNSSTASKPRVVGILLWVLLILSMAPMLECAEGDPTLPKFLRGDSNGNGNRSVSDVVHVLRYLYIDDGSELTCDDAADSNDDGRVNIADPLTILFYIFGEVPFLPEPFSSCGPDDSDDALNCEEFENCGHPHRKSNSVGMEFVYIAPGSFAMGSPIGERGRQQDFLRHSDETQHNVSITCGYYITVTEVTQAQFLAVVGHNPSYANGFRGGIDWGLNLDRPVESVTWSQAAGFCRMLSKIEERDYELPTEAQWEYACRAGTLSRFWFGDALDCIDDPCAPCQNANPFFITCQVWSDHGPCVVATKLPNPWGLFDVHDNVAEWCRDWYAPYPKSHVTDPEGPPTGQSKVFRGIANLSLLGGRSAARAFAEPVASGTNVGFRVVQRTACKPRITPH